MHGTLRLSITVVLVAWWATVTSAQTVTVVHNVNLRPDPSSEYPPTRLLLPSEPPLTLLEPSPESGYYHVQTSIGEEGYVWSQYVRVTVAATPPAGQAHHQADGMRHEPDGDTHGWLQVDSQFADMINAGNTSDEGGNLVFEVVCHYTVTQPDAQSACSGFADHTTFPPVGTHVAITGTFVQEKNHKKWNEIHPVSSIQVQ